MMKPRSNICCCHVTTGPSAGCVSSSQLRRGVSVAECATILFVESLGAAATLVLGPLLAGSNDARTQPSTAASREIPDPSKTSAAADDLGRRRDCVLLQDSLETGAARRVRKE